MSGSTEWTLDQDERVYLKPWASSRPRMTFPLVALTRVRNEALLLEDTLNHVALFADAIFLYDDASDDDTFEIAWRHPCVAAIIRNGRWRSGVDARLLSETRHRGLLLALARTTCTIDWCFCVDADERYLGDIAGFVRTPHAQRLQGARIRLFDAYMTPEDTQPLLQGQSLLNFRQYFGPEFRDILMLWRDSETVAYRNLDAREPEVEGECATLFYCQHYGKSLSIEHWESTCNYYAEHFPYESYGKKWNARRGKAIHVMSDFDRSLRRWGSDLFGSAVSL